MIYKKITIKDIKNFELKGTFECGQCFRWKKESNGSYTGVVKIGVINVNKNKNTIEICGFVDEKIDLLDFCTNYLDLNRDYDKVHKIISKDDEVMKTAIKFGKGIRILNQDPWEMLISYIISAANNIPRISKTIENISRKFGKKIKLSDVDNEKLTGNKEEKEYYLFPTPKELSKSTLSDLRECNLGFRDKYVYGAVELVNKKEIDLAKIEILDYISAKKVLTKIPGVGSKVADCILLFSMKKSEAFPVDTWIIKIMNEIYIDSRNKKRINEYALNKWGINAGIAQQYLFYYKRENS